MELPTNVSPELGAQLSFNQSVSATEDAESKETTTIRTINITMDKGARRDQMAFQER